MAKSRSVFALNSENDMYLDGETKYIARLHDSDAVLQTVRTRLLLVSQEWFLDLDSGLPWFTEIAGKSANLFRTRSYIAREILGTDGVVELKKLTLDFDKAKRKLSIEFEYVDEYGNTINGGV
jgi:hypothetical protein